MARRSIDPAVGEQALAAWTEHRDTASRSDVATAVRYTLGLLETAAPGRSVEVRVPPHAAVQCVEGGAHRRGTPRAVVEMKAQVWLALAIGEISWGDAVESGQLQASGERSNVSSYLPLR